MATPIRILHNELINLRNKLNATTPPAAAWHKLECEGWDASLVLIQESGGVSLALTAININDRPNTSVLNTALEALPLQLTLTSTSVMNSIIELNGYYKIGSCYHEESNHSNWTLNLLLRRLSSGLALGVSMSSVTSGTNTVHIVFSIRGFIPEATINV